MRPYTEDSGRGRRDTDGLEWFAGEPYPTWYRRADGVTYMRGPVWGRPEAAVLVTDPAPWVPETMADRTPEQQAAIRERLTAIAGQAEAVAGYDDLEALAAAMSELVRAATEVWTVARATDIAEGMRRP